MKIVNYPDGVQECYTNGNLTVSIPLKYIGIGLLGELQNRGKLIGYKGTTYILAGLDFEEDKANGTPLISLKLESPDETKRETI